MCKVLEHIFASNLLTHLDSHKLLYDLQHGFRSKRSCETQLVVLMEDLSRNAIKGQHTDLILSDFSKAFDKVSQEKLLLKLHHCGVRGQVLHWIKAFLSNRSQTVVLESAKSSQVTITSGVPQGSVLGPNLIFGLLLWIFYVFVLSCVCYVCARLFICASWSPAGKGLTSWLSFVVSSVSLSLSLWYPGSGVVLDCIDS